MEAIKSQLDSVLAKLEGNEALIADVKSMKEAGEEFRKNLSVQNFDPHQAYLLFRIFKVFFVGKHLALLLLGLRSMPFQRSDFTFESGNVGGSTSLGSIGRLRLAREQRRR